MSWRGSKLNSSISTELCNKLLAYKANFKTIVKIRAIRSQLPNCDSHIRVCLSKIINVVVYLLLQIVHEHNNLRQTIKIILQNQFLISHSVIIPAIYVFLLKIEGVC